ncbi:unnamed protein product [Clonostachys solani]|uniref:Oxidoreductase n=1 Tax=Clonostachys solani TaxID=160281 RepID=A0A9N9YWH4_9HYPO|nr:unnamed protein product [Clonostachys solani]
MPQFNPSVDIPDLSEKICLVTGANSGLGEAAVKALAQHKPKKIYLAARSRVRAEEALERIRSSSKTASTANVEILDLDLASLQSVKAAAARVTSEADRLDILHLNGGVAMVPQATTKEGYEIQLGTNHVGHALLTQLLLPLMLETAKLPGADVRIVSTTSASHKIFGLKEGIEFDHLKSDMKSFTGRALYAQSMLAKSLFVYELAKRYPQITSSSVHPGGVKTGAYSGDKDLPWAIRYLILKPALALTGVTPDEGAKTGLWASFSKGVVNGRYYEPIGAAGRESKQTNDDGLAKRLWDWTGEELAKNGGPGWP